MNTARTTPAELPDWVRDALRCPRCAAPLREEAGASELVCDGAAGHRFPVVEGIVRLIAD